MSSFENDLSESKKDIYKNFSSRRDAKVVHERLVDGEEILVVSTINMGIYWKPIALFLIGLLVGCFIAWELAAVLMIFALIFIVFNMLRAKILLLVVTNKRILTRYGVIMVDVVDIHFDKVESIELERMLPGLIMGYSNTVIMGTGNRLVVIPYVSNGRKIRRAYSEAVLT